MLSSRLRGKSLMPVAGKPLLLRVIERVRQMPFLDDIVVATTYDRADTPIVAFAQQQGVPCVTGQRDDVLARVVAAIADLNDSDVVVRFTGDNPLYDPALSTQAYDRHRCGNWDYTHVEGLSALVPEFIGVGALREACASASTDYEREHVTPYLRSSQSSFRVLTLENDFAGLRPEYQSLLTVDTFQQLQGVEQMLLEVEKEGEAVSAVDCYQWLDHHGNNVRSHSDVPDEIAIGKRRIGGHHPCFIVSEIGQNHNGDIRIAEQLIDMAARCGCDAVKFQKRDIEWDLTSAEAARPYENPNSFGATYGEHRRFLELSEQHHAHLKEYAERRGLIYFCTACDPPSVEAMQRIGNPCYKIASRDIDNVPLLRCIAATGKPAIVSTGMADRELIVGALQALSTGNSGLILTHCVSQYPTELSHANVRAVGSLREEFAMPVGLSDHTTGIVTSIMAAVLGCCYLEKHVTLSRAMQGTDHAAALEEEGLRRVVKYVREVEMAMGSGEIFADPITIEAAKKLGRSLVSRGPIPAGTALTEDMLMLKSPGTGLNWNQRLEILGKLARDDIPADTILHVSQFMDARE